MDRRKPRERIYMSFGAAKGARIPDGSYIHTMRKGTTVTVFYLG